MLVNNTVEMPTTLAEYEALLCQLNSNLASVTALMLFMDATGGDSKEAVALASAVNETLHGAKHSSVAIVLCTLLGIQIEYIRNIIRNTNHEWNQWKQ